MSNNTLQGMMGITMDKIKDMVDVNTIIGETITTADGSSIIPISKVTFGFASGGSDFPTKDPKQTFGGGCGAGVTINPIAFIVVSSNGDVKLMQLSLNSNSTDKAIGLVPEVIDKIAELFIKNKKSKDQNHEQDLDNSSKD